ncbi:MAG: hypothetical protein GQ559_00285, partial [Desulfobulbaceae bacterium]|nr:hypothetical protein [Desulfobulbaceae bacterium]
MEHTYKAVFTGELYPETVPDKAIEVLSTKFGLSTERAGTLVRTERPIIVKKGLDRVKGEAFCRHLKQAGLKMKLVEEKAETDKNKKSPAAPPKPSETATASVSAKKKTAPLPPVNPYAAPEANLEPDEREKKQSGDPHKVPAGHGWRWLVDAYDKLKEHPWSWIGALVVMYFLIALTSLIPVVGSFAGY